MFDQTYTYVVDGGREIVDGNIYHPNHIYVEMNVKTAMDYVISMMQQIRHGGLNDRVFLGLPGEIQLVEKEPGD